MENILSEGVESIANLGQKSALMLKFKRAPNEIYSSESEEEINIDEIPAYILESNDPPKLAEETRR